MIKAILWDFGGVITSSPFEAFNRYEKEKKIPLNFIRQLNATNPHTNAWARFESNQISLDQFDRDFEKESNAAGFSIPGREVLALLSGDIRPTMVNALKTCKSRYTVACITNNMKLPDDNPPNHHRNSGNPYQEVMALFDHVIESSKENVRKPDPEIYRITLHRLNLLPDQCIFLDDLGINLKPARAMGMKTIKVLNEIQALQELEKLTKLTFQY